ncbi:MAG: M4 family metallopeptidase [Bacteroidetes bacterium]|nr:M4 family metallopeptidase [Bacteroidota bacterium]
MQKIYSTLVASCLCTMMLGQENTEGVRTDFNSSVTGLPLHVSFVNKHLAESDFPAWMQSQYIKNDNVTFYPFKTEYDQVGMKHTKYMEYFKGYKIEDAVIISHARNQEMTAFNGEWFKTISPLNSISLTEQQALAFALKKVNAQHYKWQNEAEIAHKREVFNNPNFSYDPKGEIVLLPEMNEKTKEVIFRYAFKFNIYADKPLYRADVYVDASTGTVIKEVNRICTADAVGTANTKYSGTQSITTDSYTSGYRLREAGRGQGIETYNLNNGTNYVNTDFTNTTNTWTITTSNQAATDAHWGAEKTYDYYMTTYNRNSIDNAGYKLLSYVHYDVNYVNAFWDGQEMTYGDGDVSQGFTIMTALDVCGHEITHGLVSNTANLGSGEAGALNEAFADIFGTCIEWFARPSQHDWIMGKDIMPSGTGIRNMSNPNALQQPDTYQGTYWDASGEVHTNDGPCIYWFYLLSVGGSGTNDNSQAYNVSGITMAKASAIAYRALTTYMTPTTTYANVRNYTIQAAKDLYGSCSNEVVQTTNAWYAVGVGTQYVAGTISPNFAADQTSTCILPATVNFSNTTANGSTFKWVFGDGAVSTATNPAHTYTANGTYSVKLVATGCGTVTTKDSVLKTSYITINAPTSATGTGTSICNSGAGVLTASGSGVVNWYNAATGGTLLATGNTYTTPTINTTTTYYAVNTVTQTPIFGGPATYTTFGSGSNFNGSTGRYLIFDVLQPCTLKTVVVVANSAGNRVIELRNSSGTVVQSATVNIATGTQTVTLNFPMTPGTSYQLGTGSTSLVDLWRNNAGSGYPYNIGGAVNITGADAGSTYYYYFYNWQVQKAPCQANPTAITAVVTVCTGIDEAKASGNIQVFPNPASDLLTLYVPEDMLPQTKAIEMYDAMGKLVLSQTIHMEQTTIHVSDLARGVYTCRIISSANQQIVKRFVKE